MQNLPQSTFSITCKPLHKFNSTTTYQHDTATVLYDTLCDICNHLLLLIIKFSMFELEFNVLKKWQKEEKNSQMSQKVCENNDAL